LESRRRHRLDKPCPAAAAGARIPASWRLGLSKRKGELPGTLVQLGAARVCEEKKTEVEFAAVASMAAGGGSEPVASRTAAAWLHL
jgi:hypothetical protein